MLICTEASRFALNKPKQMREMREIDWSITCLQAESCIFEKIGYHVQELCLSIDALLISWGFKSGAQSSKDFNSVFHLGMHRSNTQENDWIGYRSDETDPNPMLCVYYCVLLLSPTKATKTSKFSCTIFQVFWICSIVKSEVQMNIKVVQFKFT